MRPGITWIIVGAVVIVVVFAGLDALRSSGGDPSPSEASGTTEVTTTRADTGAGIESSAELQSLRATRLIPGRVTTADRFVTFAVPPGWYGSQDEFGFLLARGLNGQALQLDSGGMVVNYLDAPFANAIKRLAQVTDGLRAGSAVHIAGYSGRRYSVRTRGAVVSLQNAVGVPHDFRATGPDLILLGVQGKALLIWPTFRDVAQRAEVYRVLMSFKFADRKDEIIRVSNSWARLFGAGQRCNRFMGQPVCEWVVCKRAGGARIQNCTPVSSEVQRSFAGAVVRRIVIRGRLAAARFSNGETVRFVAAPGGQFWNIDRVGAGRKLFE